MDTNGHGLREKSHAKTQIFEDDRETGRQADNGTVRQGERAFRERRAPARYHFNLSGVLRHVAAFIQGDMSPKPKAVSSHSTPNSHSPLVSRSPCLLVIATTLLAACGPGKDETVAPPSLPDDAVAVVNGVAVTYSDVERIAFQNGYNLQQQDHRDLAIRDAINFEVLASEAVKRGLDQSPDIRAYVKRESVRKLLNETVDKSSSETKEAVSEDEAQSYYEANPEEFTPPTVVKGRILQIIRYEGDKEPVYTRKLKEIQEAIKNKESSFTDLVLKYSDDPSAKTYGGLTPWIVSNKPNKKYPPEVIEALLQAEDPREIAGPIHTSSWSYFVQQVELKKGQLEDFANSKDRILKKLARQSRLEKYDKFVDSLASQAQVEEFPEKLKELSTQGHSSNLPPPGPVPGPSLK